MGIRILTMANARFKPYAQILQRQANLFRYPITIANVDGERFFSQEGAKTYIGKSPCKPRIIRRHLNHEFLVYMDADAYLKSPIDEVEGTDYDVGVTVHPPERQRPDHVYANAVGWLNAGVIFFNPSGKLFIDIWESQPSQWNSDQERLTLALKGKTDWKIGSIVDVCGFRVKLFDANIYNYNYNWGKEKCTPLQETKIIHYVGQWRSRFPL